MKKFLDSMVVWKNSSYNEGKSVVAKRLTKTLKSKIFQKLTALNSSSSLDYLDILVGEYNNTCHCFIGINLVILIILLCLTKKRWIIKLLKLDFVIENCITKLKIICCKGYTKTWSREIFVIDYVIKTNSTTWRTYDSDE